ncbi:MAG: UvrD-helicase domain-containing protein [Akkermansia sp.]|nr:UvrD-helicase domain-containing protein [Akkermansia sp.]
MSETNQRPLIYHTTSSLISASAGTGKTYQLASRYIALLMLGVAPEKIIALTFTKKAAGEFRSRILHALAEGACWQPEADDKDARNPLSVRVWEIWSGHTQKSRYECEPLANDTPLLPATVALVKRAAAEGKYPEELYAAPQEQALRDYLQLPVQDAAEYGKLLQKVIQVMSKLELSTIDSFFNTLVTSNSLELGVNSVSALDPADAAKAQRATIDDYLEARTAEHAKREEFLKLFADLTGGKGTKTISRLEKELQSHLSLYRENPLADTWADVSYFAEQCSGEFEVLSAAEATEWQKRAQELKLLLREFTAEDFPRFIYSGLGKLSRQEVPLSATMEKWLPNLALVEEYEHLSGLNRVEALAAWLRKKLPAKCLYDAQARTRSLFSLLRDYADAYEKRISVSGEFSFDDIARNARRLMSQECEDAMVDDSAYCREHLAIRTGKKYQHWMLDEFQDTSDDQFATLSPVLEVIANDAVAGEINFSASYPRPLPASLLPYHEDTSYCVTDGSIFVVGDDKQGIYGFRTGETKAFDELKNNRQWNVPVKEKKLVKSYRSSPVIMGEKGFVNQLFRKLQPVEQQSAGVNAVDLEPFTAHETAKDIPGYAEVQVIAQTEDESGEEKSMKACAYEAVCRVMRRLTVDDKTPIHGMSIAVLTRSNSDAEAVVNQLRNDMPQLPVLLVKDTLAATFCPLGEMLSFFFRWLLHPHEKVALNVVKASFMSYMFAGAESDNSAWVERRQMLDELGYTRVLQGIFHKLGEQDDYQSLPEEQHRAHQQLMRTWLDAARAFDATGGSLAAWVRRISTLSTQGMASSRYVQVMTMHKSKGLEFDAVILPFLSTDAVDNESDMDYFRSPDGRSLLLAPANKEARAQYWPGAFSGLTDTWKQRSSREAYNLLYVAVSRAKHANYIICHGAELKETKTNKKGEVKETWKSAARSVGGLVRLAFGGSTGKLAEDEILSPMGTESWYEVLKEKATVTPETAPPVPLGPAIPRRTIVTPSSLAKEEDKEQKEPADKPTSPDFYGRSAADFGSSVHECWEEITWCGEPLPCWMQPDYPRTPYQEVVYQALQQPSVRDLFTHRPGQLAYNEQAIVSIDHEQNEWTSGTIDRLVLTTDAAGKVTAAHIIDYKTNRPVPKEGYTDFYTWLHDHYEAQMTAYRELIAKAFELPYSAITLTLISCPNGAPARVVSYESAI